MQGSSPVVEDDPALQKAFKRRHNQKRCNKDYTEFVCQFLPIPWRIFAIIDCTQHFQRRF